MTVKAPMPVRNLNLVVPLAHKATAIKRADLVAAGLLKPEQAKPVREDGSAREREYQERHKALKAKAEAVSADRMALLRHVRTVAAARERDAFDLRLVAAAALGGVPWEDKDTLAELWGVAKAADLTARVDTMPVAELTQLLLDCAIVDGVLVEYHNVDGVKAGPLFALADHYGIDVRDVLARARGTRSMAKAAADAAGTSTPSTAGAGAKKGAAAGAGKKVKPRAVKYRDPATLQTWSGKGLQPMWLKAALANGRRLDDFLTEKTKEVKDEAGPAGQRCAHTGDLLEAAGV